MAATIALGTRSTTTQRVLGTPVLRGRLHQLCAIGSLPAGIHVVARSADLRAAVAVAVYALTMWAMFTTSATYHRTACSPRWKQRLRRADHSMIFVHIAGASTALCLLTLPLFMAAIVVAAVWVGAFFGVVMKVSRLSGMHCTNGSWLYLPLGWLVVATVPLMAPALGWTNLALLSMTGLSYTVGAVLFFRKTPDPLPAVFGYHEVWHVFTLVGGICQYLVVLDLATG